MLELLLLFVEFCLCQVQKLLYVKLLVYAYYMWYNFKDIVICARDKPQKALANYRCITCDLSPYHYYTTTMLYSIVLIVTTYICCFYALRAMPFLVVRISQQKNGAVRFLLVE